MDRSAQPATLVDLLSYRAAQQPDQLAYTFLADGEADAHALTYRELERRARTVAALLRETCTPGDRALLLYPPGLAYITAFFGCLYAGVTAVPAYPPNPIKVQRTLPRLLTIVRDARPAVALTTAEILPVSEAMAAVAPDFGQLRWLATDGLDADAADAPDPSLSGDTLAMLQYTSGSTSAPKGVMLSHSNLLHNLQLIHSCYGHSPRSQGVIWLPPYHDMGLIGGILQPLYGGFPVTLMAPVAFLQRPLRWLQAISRERATTSGGPNFAYELCVRKITAEQRDQLDLSSWTVAFNGAEPIRSETLDAFAAFFAPCGFRRDAFLPCYGLAEATLIVAGKAHDARPVVRSFAADALEQHRALAVPAADSQARALVGCGPALADQQIAIVQPETRRSCAPDAIGEVWVSGPSVAQGYWGRVEETEQSFQAQLADRPGRAFLRTGDLGFLHDGELFITGRLKDLLIIRGRNYYPHDIELTVERSHPALRPGSGAAFTVEIDGDERLVVAQEIEREHRRTDPDALAATIRRAVAEQHDLHIYAVALLKTGSLPKTSSGKIQRRATRAEFLAGTLSLIGSSVHDEHADASTPLPTRDDLRAATAEQRQSLLESYLRQAVARVLQAPLSSIAADQPISSLGLDSLMAVEVQHRLETDLGVALPMSSFLEGASLAQLAAEALNQIAADQPAPQIVAQPAQDAYPLSYGQRSLWFLHQLAPDSAAYNVAGAVRIISALDVPALHRAFEELVRRHAALRTTFALRAGAPVQIVQPDAALHFSSTDAAGWTERALNERLTEAAHQPFDLQRGPLLRVHLWTRAADEHVLLLVIHHIVSDLWSLAILVQELGALYAAERQGRPRALEPLPIGYSDYARWQEAWISSPAGQRDRDYWQQQLGPAGSPAATILNLPTDRRRPAVQTYHGVSQPIALSPELTRLLKDCAQQHQATLYMLLLAGFQALLHRYSGQDDLIVGSPTTGRGSAELAGLVGYFVNPIAVRTQFTPGMTFTQLLSRVRQTVLAGLEHAEYPLAALIERLQLPRDASRSPLFQVMFILQKAPLLGDGGLERLALGAQGARLQLGELTLETISLEQRIAQFDLTLTLGESDGRLLGTFEYNTALFEAATIARWAEHLQQLLASVAADPQQPIAAVALLSAAERQRLAAWNATATDDEPLTLVELFERQVALEPDAVAVVLPADTQAAGAASTRRSLSYRELNARANQLARELRALGVAGPAQAEIVVGLYLPRSLELVVAILAVIKAGAAYLPLDPEYPAERRQLMMQSARATILLTQQSLLDSAAHDGQLLCLDRDWPRIARQPADDLAGRPLEQQVACVIFTSGSTGAPKGVLLEQRSLVNLVRSFIESYQPGPADRVLPLTAIASASFVGEVLPILCSGGALVLPAKAEFLDFQKLIGLLAAEQVSILSTVPALLAGINALAERLPRLRLILSGGEALFASQIDRLLGAASVVNGYGLTETTICSTYYSVQPADLRADTPISIGRPLRNTQIYVLDAQMQPTPIGVPGELYIGGDGLARGYLSEPALTAERFVPNPFTEPRTENREQSTDALAANQEPSNGTTQQGHRASSLRLYKTGDRARWRNDGTLEYLGRLDQQVKLRGFRIELGEIETRLTQHPAVREAVVVARELEPAGETRLVAYVVGKEPRTKNQEPNGPHAESGSQFLVPSSHELRSFLADKLPDYMIPSAFVLLDALPLTSNGKVDLRALPLPESARPTLAAAYVAPQSEAERMIAAVWQEVLGLPQVGVDDNFFELGGHSLLLVKAHSALVPLVDRPLSLVDLFKFPTVSALAQHLSRPQEAAPSFAHVEAVAEKQRQARSRRQQLMRASGRLGEKTDE